tara:strand:- start:104 stop:484 length:381 start_codon:yes stop_codon:yes gene_type:complete
MKSTLLIGTALLMSVGAIAHAQDMGGTSMPPSDPMTTNPTTPMGDPTAPMPSTPNAPMPSAPEAPATDPMANTAPAPAAPTDSANMVMPAPATQEYPLCSATITDQCMQPSEAPKGYGKKKSMKRR